MRSKMVIEPRIVKVLSAGDGSHTGVIRGKNVPVSLMYDLNWLGVTRLRFHINGFSKSYFIARSGDKLMPYVNEFIYTYYRFIGSL